MRTSVQTRRASFEDVDWIATHLREEDEMEVRAATGDDPVAVLHRSYLLSAECHSVFLRGSEVPCALFGVVRNEAPGEPGVAWMLCTPEVTEGIREVLVEAERWVEGLAETYSGLQALAWANNYLHVRWCRYLGFVELGRVTINGEQFIHIYKAFNGV